MGSAGKIPRKFTYIYFIITIASLTSVIITSYYGGKLVFEHGIGVKSTISVKKEIKLPEANNKDFQFLKTDTTQNQ